MPPNLKVEKEKTQKYRCQPRAGVVVARVGRGALPARKVIMVTPADAVERCDQALDIAKRYGGIDGDHHKAWVIDQMCRVARC